VILSRRPGRSSLALIFLALLLQALAPGQAARMAAARLDPLWNAPICSVGSQDGRSSPDTRREGHCQSACLVCSAASTVAILGAAPAPAIPTDYVMAAQPIAVPASAAGAPRPRPKARGPPLIS
jgi:hypothetical protein